MELNGKTYEMQYLTDEETAVINAMRMGAKVQASFFFSTDEAIKEHAKQISLETFPKGGPSDLGDGLTAHHFKSDKVDIVHFVQQKTAHSSGRHEQIDYTHYTPKRRNHHEPITNRRTFIVGRSTSRGGVQRTV